VQFVGDDDDDLTVEFSIYRELLLTVATMAAAAAAAVAAGQFST